MNHRHKFLTFILAIGKIWSLLKHAMRFHSVKTQQYTTSFNLYQWLQCTITSLKLNLFSFFIYCCDCTYMSQNHGRIASCLDKLLLLSDRQWGTKHQYLTSRFLGVSILQLLIIYRIYDYLIRCHSNSVSTGSRLPNISDVKTRERRNMIGLTWFETSALQLFYSFSKPSTNHYLKRRIYVTLKGRLYPRRIYVTLKGGLHPRRIYVNLKGRLHPRRIYVNLKGGFHPRHIYVNLKGGLHPRSIYVNLKGGLYPRRIYVNLKGRLNPQRIYVNLKEGVHPRRIYVNLKRGLHPRR